MKNFAKFTLFGLLIAGLGIMALSTVSTTTAATPPDLITSVTLDTAIETTVPDIVTHSATTPETTAKQIETLTAPQDIGEHATVVRGDQEVKQIETLTATPKNLDGKIAEVPVVQID